MKPRSTPLTRYDFISQLAQEGLLASIQDGWIIRPLQPQAAPRTPPPQPRPHAELRAIFRAGDHTHTWPRG